MLKRIKLPCDIQSPSAAGHLLQDTARTCMLKNLYFSEYTLKVDSGLLSTRSQIQSPRTNQAFADKTQNKVNPQQDNEAGRISENNGEAENSKISEAENNKKSNLTNTKSKPNRTTSREDNAKKTQKTLSSKSSHSSKRSIEEIQKGQTTAERNTKLKESQSPKFSKANESLGKRINVKDLVEAKSPPRKYNSETNSKEVRGQSVQTDHYDLISSLDLEGYLKYYSQQIQHNIKQKLSYSLAFEIKKHVIECRKQIIDDVFGNVKKMNQEFYLSLREALNAGGVAISVLEKHQNEFDSSFDKMLRELKTNNKDQNFLDTFYIQAQELDSLLAKEADEKFFKEDDKMLKQAENEIAKCLRERFNHDIKENFEGISSIVSYEFSKMSGQFKATLHESIDPNFQKLIERLKMELPKDLPVVQESQSEDLDNKLFEDQFPEPIENLPKQQPEVSQLERKSIIDQNLNENQASSEKLDVPMEEADQKNTKLNNDFQEEQSKQSEDLQSAKKRSFGKELNNIMNVLPVDNMTKTLNEKKSKDFSTETFGANRMSQQSCQLRRNSDVLNGSEIEHFHATSQPPSQAESINMGEPTNQQFPQPPPRKRCFGIRTAEIPQVQRHLKSPSAQLHEKLANQPSYFIKDTSRPLHSQYYSNSIYETTNEIENCLSRNEDTITVQSFTNLAESHKKALSPKNFASADSGLRGIIQRIELPPANVEIHTLKSQSDYKKGSLHTEDYRTSELVEELISKSNDSIEETRFHHDTLPPYGISQESLNISSGSPDLDIMKALQRSNEVLAAIKSSLHASKGRFYNTLVQEERHHVEPLSRNYPQNLTTERWGVASPSHRLGSSK